MPTITLPDGSQRQFRSPVSVARCGRLYWRWPGQSDAGRQVDGRLVTLRHDRVRLRPCRQSNAEGRRGAGDLFRHPLRFT